MATTYKLDVMIKVDETLCINCGSCIKACPRGPITKKDFPAEKYHRVPARKPVNVA